MIVEGGTSAVPGIGHAALMDRVYGRTRHVYDATRKFFLLGRDRLLSEMEVRPGDSIVEIGCGTARNLVRLARLHPDAALFGLDASERMLETARAKVRRLGLEERITLRQCLAERLDHRGVFGLGRPFDAAVFSYSLSMMPDWRGAIGAVIASVRPGGVIHIVDFCDQADLPRWFGAGLAKWLQAFHVRHRPELVEHLYGLACGGVGRLSFRTIGGRYAYLARLRVAGPA